MVASKANIGLLFDVQALTAQNEVNRKQTDKRRRQVKIAEQLQEVADKAVSKVKQQKAHSKDLISRRRASQMAMNMLSAKNAAQKAAKMEELIKKQNEFEGEKVEVEETTTEVGKELNTEKNAETKTSKEANSEKTNAPKAETTTQKTETAKTAEAKPVKEVEVEEFVEAIKGVNNFFSEEEIQSAKNVFKDINELQEKMAAQGKEEYVMDMDASTKDIIDDIFKPENLLDCTASEAELAETKKEVLENARYFRQIAKVIFPKVEVAARQEVAKMGIDLTDPKQNPYLKDKDGNLVNINPVPYFAGTSLNSKYFSVREEDETEEAEEKPSSGERKDIDQAIFACVFRSIEMNQLLHELGIKTQISQGRIQKTISKDLVEEAQKQYKKTIDQIEKAKEQEECAKIMKIVGIVFAVILTPIAPAIGIPLLLASTGALDKMITALANALGIPEYVIQSIIAIAALIIATVVSIICPPAAPMAFGYAIFIAGLVGWIESTIGVIATGQTDPEKFPEWVGWAAMGVEIGLSLLTMGSGIMNSVRSIGTGLMKVGLAGAKVGARVGLVSSKTVASLGARVATRVATQAARSAASAATKTAATAAKQASKAASAASKAAKAGLAAESKAAARVAREASRVADAASAKAVEAATKAARSAAQASSQSLNPAQIGQAVESAVQSATQGAKAAASAARASAEGASTVASAAGRAAGQGSATAVSSGMSTNTAAIRSEIASIEKSVAQLKDAKSLAGAPIQGVSTSSSSSSSRASSLARQASVQTKFEKALEEAQQIIEKYIKKLLAKIYSAKGAATDAAGLASMARGAETASRKAERAYQILVKLMRLSKQFARWMQLAHQGATAAAQIEMARMKMEIGDLLEEAAKITGEMHFLEQFLSTFGMAIKSTQEQKKQYAQDSADAVQTLGEIIATQRRANSMLMSA